MPKWVELTQSFLVTHAEDIKIDGFSMSLKGTELISDCSIELTIGRRYGLLGANGELGLCCMAAFGATCCTQPRHAHALVGGYDCVIEAVAAGTPWIQFGSCAMYM